MPHHFRDRSDPSSLFSSSARQLVGAGNVPAPGNENSPSFQSHHTRLKDLDFRFLKNY